MKKITALLLVLVMACTMSTALADEDIVGEWYGTFMGNGLVMKLNADQSVTMEVGGNIMGEGTWKAENGSLTISSGDGSDEVYEIKEDGIYIASMDITLTRDPANAAPAIEFAEVKSDVTKEEFYGDWTCTAISMSGMVASAEDYAASTGGDVLPGLTISDSSIQFTGEGMFAVMFSLMKFESEYTDGAILVTGTAIAGDSTVAVKIEMLQDNTLKVSIEDEDMQMALYYAPAVANAEEPAA